MNHQPAGIFRRYAAYLIDSFIVTILCLVTLVLIIPPGSFSHMALALPGLFYFVCFEQSKWQATPGKKLLNIRVVDDANNKPSFTRSLMRYVAYALPGMIWTFIYNDYFADFISITKAKGPEPLALILGFFIFLNYILVSQALKFIWCLPIFWTREKLTVHDLLTKTKVKVDNLL